MFRSLVPEEIERLRRFGEVRSYSAGSALAQVGEAGDGLTIILAGNVDITQRHETGRRQLIVSHGPGGFMGELAQLVGRPSLVDAHAQDSVEVLVIPPDRLRALLGARGYVSAYEIETGRLAWRFYPVPGSPDQPPENAAMALERSVLQFEWARLRCARPRPEPLCAPVRLLTQSELGEARGSGAREKAVASSVIVRARVVQLRAWTPLRARFFI